MPVNTGAQKFHYTFLKCMLALQTTNMVVSLGCDHMYHKVCWEQYKLMKDQTGKCRRCNQSDEVKNQWVLEAEYFNIFGQNDSSDDIPAREHSEGGNSVYVGFGTGFENARNWEEGSALRVEADSAIARGTRTEIVHAYEEAEDTPDNIYLGSRNLL